MPNKNAALPTFAEVKSYAPGLFDLADRYENETVAGNVDFDLEVFDAAEAAVLGADEGTVLAFLSPEHPGSAEAVAVLKERLRQPRDLN